MQHLDVILLLATALGAALAFGYATHRLGLSPIVGYLLAGVAVGPFTPGGSVNQNLAEQMAEIGVILLMFGVGLHFHVDELLAVRRIALPGALIQVTAAAAGGAGAAWLFGWPGPACVFFGLAVALASTVVLTRVLTDNNDLHTQIGHIAVGWLIVQDVLAVLALVLLPAFYGPEGVTLKQLPLIVAVAAAKVAGLAAAVLLVGGRLVPWLLHRAADTKSRELFTLTVLVVALGVAAGSATVFGVSVALGAFLAGMVVGRSDFSVRAATEALPMRDAFAVLFFVSVGMLFDPRFLMKRPSLVLGTLAVVLLLTPSVAFLITLLRGYPVRVAFGVALALTQIGEFSFILAALGKSLGALPDEATQTLVAVAIVTISLNPLLYRLTDKAIERAAKHPQLWGWLRSHAQKRLGDGPAPEPAATDPERRAVVVGYGPVGVTVSRLLSENEVEVTVVELNIETVRQLRARGVHAVYGDATHEDTLKEAGVAGARSLILSSAGMTGSEEVIKIARRLNPRVRVLARALYVKELATLKAAGAEVAFSGEGEVALALTEAILRRLGASGEQVDRERDRVRDDLAAGTPDPATSRTTSAGVDV